MPDVKFHTNLMTEKGVEFMQVRNTRPEDLDVVMDIYDHAREYMRQNGNQNQWINGYPHRELVIKDIEEKCSYVCVDQERIVCVFRFTIGTDPTYLKIYDGQWLNEEPYGVVHRIASAGHQKGAASFCLDWCFAQTGNIRIDTHEDNYIMQKLLIKNGYTRCGNIYLEDGAPRIAFHKVSPITTIVLDIGNVLAHFRWKEYMKDCGYSDEIIDRIADATVRTPVWKEWDRGTVEEDELIKMSIAREPELKEEINRFFSEFNDVVMEYEHSSGFVKQLKDNGYRVYLLSNYSGRHFELHSPYFRFKEFVDGGIISYQVKHIKPEPAIYQALIDKYQINPSQAVFLDDLQENLEGAKPFGFYTILVKNHAQALEDLRRLGVRI